MKTLAELATHINAELIGDRTCTISRLAPLTSASTGDLSFLANPKYRKFLSTTQASAVLLRKEDLEFYQGNALVTADPYLGYAKISQLFETKPLPSPGIHPSAVIGEGCQIPSSVFIGAQCVIGNHVTFGEGVRLHPGCVIGDNVHLGAGTEVCARVTLYYGVRIGERVLIHSGVVIGSDGFGFAEEKRRWVKIAQLGGVLIGNDVEIGANTTIDRGAFGDTVIEEGVKLDNQIQIAHNVVIGAHTAIAGCVGIAGSAKIGKHCRIGGATCINGHIEIADGTAITGMAMVTHSITTPGIYSSGTGIFENHEWQKNVIRFRQLDQLSQRVKQLEKKILCEDE